MLAKDPSVLPPLLMFVFVFSLIFDSICISVIVDSICISVCTGVLMVMVIADGLLP